IALPAGRCAISTRPSGSMRAQAATSTRCTPNPRARNKNFVKDRSTPAAASSRRLTVALSGLRELRPIVAVDGNVFLSQIAGEHAVATVADAERDFKRDLRPFHHLRQRRLVVVPVALAVMSNPNAAEPD